MDQRQRQSDGQGGEPFRGPAVGRAEDGEQEDRREDDLGDGAGRQVVPVRRMGAVAVGSEPACLGVEPGLPAGQRVEHSRSHDRRDDLGDDVGQDVAGVSPLAQPQPQRHGGVEVAPGDVPEGVGHREHRQAEGQGNAQQPDPDRGELGGQHRAPASTQNQYKRPDEFRRQPFTCGHVNLPSSDV